MQITRINHTLCHSNRQNQVSQKAANLFIRHVKLEEKDPNILHFFKDGHLSVQINHTPGTTKGVDHEGEQENKILKIQSGLTGLTKRETSRNKLFLILHKVLEIEQELQEIPHSQRKETKIDHALNQNENPVKEYTAQNMKFSIKDFYSKCNQTGSFLLIWSHLLKKS